jgi:hypothetical protein
MGRSRTPEETSGRRSEAAIRAHARRRERARVQPKDLVKLRRSGTVPEHLLPFLESAELEAGEFIEASGGPDMVSPKVKAILEDTARMGLVLRAELARYIQTGDSDAGSRVGTLASARRASLVAIGLERFEKTLDLQTYLRQRAEDEAQAPEAAQAPAGPTNGEAGEPEVVVVEDRAARGEDAREDKD